MQRVRSDRSQWRGPLAHPHDNLFWFGSRGLIFTSPSFVSASTTRPAAVLLLSATREPLEVSGRGQVIHGDAVCIAPMCTRRLRAVDAGMISINVHAQHPGFHEFCELADAGMLRLDRSAFARYDELLLDAWHGRLGYLDASELFEAVVATAAEQLPRRQPIDSRATALRDLLRKRPDCTLEEMAEELNVSYTTASHVFARVIGVPLRSYQLWIKAIRAACRMAAGASLTHIAHEVGFVDSAHLSRTWRRIYGFAPSFITDAANLSVQAKYLHGGAAASPHVAMARHE